MVIIKEKSCSSRAEIKFHIGCIHRLLRKERNAERLGAGAGSPRHLTIEYLAATADS